MTNGSLNGSLTASVVSTAAPPFIPGGQQVSVTLQPSAEVSPYLPPASPPVSLPRTPIPQNRTMVIDIETTGLDPWDARIITIGALSVRNPNNVQVFTDENEETLVREFISWFTSNGFTDIIGYNTDFDYRFIFAKMMRYNVVSPEFMDAELLDMLTVMRRAKRNYVDSTNKPGGLKTWLKYLFDLDPPIESEDVLKAFDESRIEDIESLVMFDVTGTYLLWLLWNVIRGEVNVGE